MHDYFAPQAEKMPLSPPVGLIRESYKNIHLLISDLLRIIVLNAVQCSIKFSLSSLRRLKASIQSINSLISFFSSRVHNSKLSVCQLLIPESSKMTMPSHTDGDEPIEYIYKTYRLDPLSPNFSFLTGKYAAISMAALTTDPTAFGMSYTTEASFTPADWAKRLSRTNVHVFICVAHPLNLAPELYDVEHGSWVGMVTQIGSTPKSVYWLPESGAEEPLDDGVETHWHQTATWNEPAHRGRGIGKQLVETAVAYASKSIVGDIQQARVRAFARPGNEASRRLYVGRGFVHVGSVTLGEAIVANGNAEFGFLGRFDWPESLVKRRAGMLMEMVVRKKV
jgi:GNAT superfamily N-acetyltransferase